MEDTTLAWVCAPNLRLYDEDPGPRATNVGSSQEPRVVDRREALVELYARQILLELRAELPRILALRDDCAREAAAARTLREAWRVVQARRGGPHPQPWPRALRALTWALRRDISTQWTLGAELADRAAHMVTEAEADRDAKARARLLASTVETRIISGGGTDISPARCGVMEATLRVVLRYRLSVVDVNSGALRRWRDGGDGHRGDVRPGGWGVSGAGGGGVLRDLVWQLPAGGAGPGPVGG
ncbi:hypothetical protein [Pseudonocardia nigra]|uniref:hypothetical protein n=1 Tax=Pseudonocardia nigra TaxID=1921578 RepID=UPI0027E26EC5|nr:hypothetical protein [Pseudonocardia nigra]